VAQGEGHEFKPQYHKKKKKEKKRKKETIYVSYSQKQFTNVKLLNLEVLKVLWERVLLLGKY
jgi:hypothetical protein